MTKKVGFLFTLGALVTMASLGYAQHQYGPAGPINDVGTTWTGGLALGTSPSGTYSSYLVVTDWGGSSPANDQWSSEARFSLHGGPLSGAPGTGAGGPAGSGTIHVAVASTAVGSANNVNSQTDMFWFGNFANAYTSDGSNDLYFSARQTFAGGGQADWSNIRVVLNPNVNDTRTLNGLAGPANFTDLGTLIVGNTAMNMAVDNTNTGEDGASWFRFQVDKNVGPDRAFDIFTSGVAGGANQNFDTRVTLWRTTASGLIPVAGTDDMGGTNGLHGGVTFGSSDPNGLRRNEYNSNHPLFFNGRGGTQTLANAPLDYYANNAGAGRLFASEEYFLRVSHFSGTAFTSSILGGGTTLGGDGVSVNLVGDVTFGAGNPTTAMGIGNVQLNFYSIPEPSSALLLTGLLGAMISIRRRKLS